ncbi:MAG: hypothetical protein GY899_13150 [Verrucomicrobiaceae bacterium]|nr:hypothetical protein [Verrucomicrobiaceae bacterium]
MKRKLIYLAFVLGIFSCIGNALAADLVDGPKYNFVCADYAKGEVCVVGSDGEIKRVFKTRNPNDVWALPNGEILFAWRMGVKIYDREGKLEFEWNSSEKRDEIHTCQPLPDGSVLIAQNGRSRLLEVNRKGEIVREVPVKSRNNDLHMRFRMCRKLKNGNYLCMISCDNEIREIDPQGKVVRVIKEIPGVKLAKAHAVMRLSNGNTLFSTGAGAMAVEIDKDDKVVWKLERKDVPEIKMGFMTGMNRLDNGNTVISFYQGSHHVIEVTPEKEVVWKWRLPSQRTVVSVQVLDGAGDASKGQVIK